MTPALFTAFTILRVASELGHDHADSDVHVDNAIDKGTVEAAGAAEHRPSAVRCVPTREPGVSVSHTMPGAQAHRLTILEPSHHRAVFFSNIGAMVVERAKTSVMPYSPPRELDATHPARITPCSPKGMRNS